MLQVLWQALKSGGIYVVEDLSENYIEKPFLDKGTFTNFMKTAIDTVQCRCLPPPCLGLPVSQTQTHPPSLHGSVCECDISLQMPSPSRSKSGACVRRVLHQSLMQVRDVADSSFCRRMKPAYMGPDSPVKEEFKEFCASNAMDSERSHASCQ